MATNDPETNKLNIQFELDQARQLHQAGKAGEAEIIYRRILAQQPNHSEALNLLGVIESQRGNTDLAAELFKKAIAADPSSAVNYNNLAVVANDLGRYDAAAQAGCEAIRLRPNYAQAHYNLGNAFRGQGQATEALDAYRRAIQIQPDYFEAYNNLGNLLNEKGLTTEAHRVYLTALKLKPDYAETHNNIGTILHSSNQLDAAISAYHNAIKFKPDFADAHNNLGSALKDQGLIKESLEEYRIALHINPNYHQAHSNLILTMHCDAATDTTEISRCLAKWNQLHAEPLKNFIQSHLNDPDPERRLRIGYVSADFREHVVGWNLLPLFLEHNHALFDIFCYSSVKKSDPVTEILRSKTHAWRDIHGVQDAQAAQMIRDDKIDILVDLAVHSGDNRLLIFARKPAPIQVTWLGYPGSTGLKTIDYRLSDPYLDPPDIDLNVYSEKTVRLPETYWCYRPGGLAPQIAPLPAMSAGRVTFGCLNNFSKVSPAALNLWSQKLRDVPKSRLILHAKAGSHLDAVRKFLAQNGVASERVEFVGCQSWPDYINTYNRIDIALDPFPYNGGITTCDSLYMGVPVVSLSGQTAVGRAGKSILTNVGLPELVAKTPEEYVEIAVKLAGDLPWLAELRKTLRQRMEHSPLMDAKRFTNNVEAIYRDIWRQWATKSL